MRVFWALNSPQTSSETHTKMAGSFYGSSKQLTPRAILYLSKSHMRPKMEYCSHTWAVAAHSLLSSFDRLQTRHRYRPDWETMFF